MKQRRTETREQFIARLELELSQALDRRAQMEPYFVHADRYEMRAYSAASAAVNRLSTALAEARNLELAL